MLVFEQGLDVKTGDGALEDRKMRCPACGWTDVRRSASKKSLIDRLLATFSLQPFRCRTCAKRFYRFQTKVQAAEIDPDTNNGAQGPHPPESPSSK